MSAHTTVILSETKDIYSSPTAQNDRKGLALSLPKGFTLIELLVVISIIAILSVIGITVFSGVQKNARTAKRIADMTAIRTALDIYYYNNNSQYPRTDALGGGWRSECNIGAAGWGIGNLSPDQVIPGLVPQYMTSFPSDPAMDKPNYRSCYMYISNGNDYKLLDHDIGEVSTADYMKYPSFIDPMRNHPWDGLCADTSGGIWSWQISSPGGRCTW